ncbi:unnamed protein product [Rhizoctonia solani]|uniref:Protein kinase domain-containing protein n=1 Tax=Rhizoctonia solani TaxID=456999 RepID=A0A8H3GYI3_9AGAM|nr:unnamed protein product [Rhizoctonia solani]
MKMILGTLQGLDYMHNLNSGPIAHGDIKLSNILVTASETPMICDFGRSGEPRAPPVEVSDSSPFAGTVRYMSPELFAQNVTRPTPAADMWAYGCIALEVLCRIPPYHEVSGEYEIARLIKTGQPPSIRPHGARASLINDILWDALSSCWKAPDWRPTSHAFLGRLTQMQERGEIPPSPVLFDLFPAMDSGPITIVPWPEKLVDLKGIVDIEWNAGKLASSVRSSVWMAFYTQEGIHDDLTPVVVKVPRLNANRENSTRHDCLQNILRKMVLHRYGVRHRNIVDLLGIDSTFTPHPGFVLEDCSEGNLVTYCKENPIVRHELTRPPAPEANAFSLMCDILQGLQYMHNYPIPIPQGDLTPENILVDRNGVAKISLFSIGRALAALPPTEAVTASIGSLLPLRWISPELLLDQQPTTESDMWAVGCVYYWILTGLQPYATYRRDDFAGAESVQRHPPGTLENVDVYHSSWITNGIWGVIGRCWKYDPFLRPSSKEFLRVLQKLEGRKLRWLPLNVVDLAGKCGGGNGVDNSHDEKPTNWSREFNYVKQKREEDAYVSMNLYETTYAPKWYSKSTPVFLKLAPNKPFNKQPSIAILKQPNYNSRDCIQILKDVIQAITYLHDHPNGSIAHGYIHPIF